MASDLETQLGVLRSRLNAVIVDWAALPDKEQKHSSRKREFSARVRECNSLVRGLRSSRTRKTARAECWAHAGCPSPSSWLLSPRRVRLTAEQGDAGTDVNPVISFNVVRSVLLAMVGVCKSRVVWLAGSTERMAIAADVVVGMGAQRVVPRFSVSLLASCASLPRASSASCQRLGLAERKRLVAVDAVSASTINAILQSVNESGSPDVPGCMSGRFGSAIVDDAERAER